MTKKTTTQKPKPARRRGRPSKKKQPEPQAGCDKGSCCLSKLCVCGAIKGLFGLLKRLVGR